MPLYLTTVTTSMNDSHIGLVNAGSNQIAEAMARSTYDTRETIESSYCAELSTELARPDRPYEPIISFFNVQAVKLEPDEPASDKPGQFVVLTTVHPTPDTNQKTASHRLAIVYAKNANAAMAIAQEHAVNAAYFQSPGFVSKSVVKSIDGLTKYTELVDKR